ncbi:hypothetical protein B5F10_07760 [Anaerotruncus colihominis]|uniref:Uncharacterized protein n=1 Tax=Anaerotruncus colihominis TaxID=169435 RepID=A0A1Y4N5Q5_9FIRM|nr:hypothetical protein [Anaerotruncus colihominis]OUP69412.1 hypothetical protein B5F11_08645 [Anaerotruncus colihominis]OUP74542.1 hypothetical protein B5F10_07760 [Anaerotruncus colihominis]
MKKIPEQEQQSTVQLEDDVLEQMTGGYTAPLPQDGSVRNLLYRRQQDSANATTLPASPGQTQVSQLPNAAPGGTPNAIDLTRVQRL